MNNWNLLFLKAAMAPTTGSGAGLSFWRIFGAWLLCIGIAVLLILILRRIRNGRSAGPPAFFPRLLSQPPCRVEIVETRRATVSVDLCVLDYDGERYLIACGPSGTTLLDRSPLPPSTEEKEEG
jgi:hypothetical protein